MNNVAIDEGVVSFDNFFWFRITQEKLKVHLSTHDVECHTLTGIDFS